MDSQLPRDPMEEFLRQSLGDYRPDPPADMWDRISSGMGTPSSPPPTKAAPATAWLSMAATVLVLVVAAAQHYYYSAQIRQLSGELEVLQQSQPLQGGRQSYTAATTTSLPKAAQAIDSPARRAAGGSFLGKKMTAERPGLHAGLATQQPAAGLAQQASFALPSVTDHKAGGTVAIPASAAALPTVERISSPLDWLQRTRIRSLLLASSVPAVPQLPTDVARRPLRLVAQGGFLRKELVVNDIRPEDNGPRPDRGSRVETEVLQATARFAGLKGTATLGSRWRLSTGISLMTSSVQAVHHSGFQVGDRNRGHRHNNRPPRGEWDSDFDCSLPSLSGSVTVGLRVAQLHSGGPLNEEAAVNFDIYTSEEITQLMLPLGIGYAFTSGRLSVTPELGFVAGVNLRESNRVTAATIDQQNAYFDSNINPFLDEAKSNTFSMDVTAAMAFNWQINSRLSIGLQPMVMRSVKLNSSDNQYQQTAWGGAVSLGYQL